MDCKPIFPSFPSPFSLSSLPMLSPLSKILLLLRCEMGWPAVTTAAAVGAAARRPAVVGGGAAAKSLFFQIFLWFLLPFALFCPFFYPKSSNTNPKLLDLRKTKGKKGKENYLYEFGSVVVMARTHERCGGCVSFDLCLFLCHCMFGSDSRTLWLQR